jgi:adenylate cyclase
MKRPAVVCPHDLQGIGMSVTTASRPAYRVVCLAVALLLAVAAFFLARRSLSFPPELRAWDTLFRVRGRLPVRADFVLVAGDEKSIRELGKPPWSRRVWADVVREIHRAEPKAIVLDRFFEQRDTSRPGSDAALWKALADARDVSLPLLHTDPVPNEVSRDTLRGLVALEKSTVTSQFTRLQSTPDYAWLGFRPPVSDFAVSARGMGVSTVNQTADLDGVIRRTRTGWVSPIAYPASPPLPEPSKLSGSTGVVPGLPVIAAMLAFDVSKEDLSYVFGDRLLIAGRLRPPVLIPIDGIGSMGIDYVGPAGTIPRYSLVDVARGRVAATAFKGKLVFVGLTTGVVDNAEPLPTPFGLMPRVEITANAVHSILNRDYLSLDTLHAPLYYLLAFGLLLGIIIPLFRPGLDLLAAILLLLLYLAFAVLALRLWSVLLPVLPAVVLALSFSIIAFLLRLGIGRAAPVATVE